MTKKIAICVDDSDCWTIELHLSSAEEQMHFGLTIVAGETFGSMRDAAAAVAGAVDLDLRLARLSVRH